MKKRIVMILCAIFNLILILNAQTIGTKKQVNLKLVSFQCGDYCNISMKDIKSGESYDIAEMSDEKTPMSARRVIIELQDLYYKYEEDDSKLKGRIFLAELEYRRVDIYDYSDPPKKTGKKISKWMLNSLIKK